MAKKTKAYIVKTVQHDQLALNLTIAYATGDPEDIKLYYQNEALHKDIKNLRIKPITIINVSPKMVTEQKETHEKVEGLKAKISEKTEQKLGLEAELTELKDELQSLKG